MTTVEQQIAIAELELTIAKGMKNWYRVDQIEDAIYNLKTYGQAQHPSKLYNEDGSCYGYRLENGEEVYYRGMSVCGNH